MEPITIKLPRKIIKELDDLVRMGIFSSRSEAIREGIRMLLKGYRRELENVKE